MKNKRALTPRERQILELMIEGTDYQTIARTLGIDYHTVYHHVQAVSERTGVHGRTNLVVLFWRLRQAGLW